MYKFCEYSQEELEIKLKHSVFPNMTIFHTQAWNDVLRDCFDYKIRYFGVENDEKSLAAVVPMALARNIAFKKVMVSLPFVNYLDIMMTSNTDEIIGFIFENLNKMVATEKLEYIEFRFKDIDDNSIDSAKVNNSVNCNLKNYTFVILLEDGEEKVFSSFSASNRNHIRKAIKNQWFNYSFDEANIDGFYDVYCRNMKRLGSPAPSKYFFYRILERFPENTKLLTVFDATTSEIVGGMFLLLWKDTVYYQWGSSLIQYNRKYINNYMYWMAIKNAINEGFKYFDLGRSPEKSGTYKFKEQWGACLHNLKYIRIYKNSLCANKEKLKDERESLKIFIEMWKYMPQFFTRYVGERIIKYVLP